MSYMIFAPSCSVFLYIIFFFMQRTADDLRMSDWSSDVCSSALDARLPGQRGQPLDLTVRIVGDADRTEVGSIQAGQHGHRHDPGVGGSGGLGIFEHRASAGGMDRQYGRLQRSQSLDRLGGGVGDVVELEVQEDGQVQVRKVEIALAAIGGGEFDAELDAADMMAHPDRKST